MIATLLANSGSIIDDNVPRSRYAMKSLLRAVKLVIVAFSRCVTVRTARSATVPDHSSVHLVLKTKRLVK